MDYWPFFLILYLLICFMIVLAICSAGELKLQDTKYPKLATAIFTIGWPWFLIIQPILKRMKKRNK